MLQRDAALRVKMPKIKKKYQDLVQQFGTDVVFCKICSKALPEARKFTLDQYMRTSLDEAARLRKLSQPNPEQQQLFSSVSSGGFRTKFASDLCAVFIAADIPLHKLSHPELR